MYKNCNSLGSFPKNYVTSFSKVNKIKNVYSKKNVVDLYKKIMKLIFISNVKLLKSQIS